MASQPLATQLGFTVLTANIADFDYPLQLTPAGSVLFYRRAQTPSKRTITRQASDYLGANYPKA